MQFLAGAVVVQAGSFQDRHARMLLVPMRVDPAAELCLSTH